MSKDGWDKAQIISQATIAVLIPIAVVVLTYRMNIVMKEREISAQELKQAIEIAEKRNDGPFDDLLRDFSESVLKGYVSGDLSRSTGQSPVVTTGGPVDQNGKESDELKNSDHGNCRRPPSSLLIPPEPMSEIKPDLPGGGLSLRGLTMALIEQRAEYAQLRSRFKALIVAVDVGCSVILN